MNGGAAPPSLEAGTIVGERYRLQRALGEGAMGWVWEGTHVHTHKKYALKFLKGGREEDRKRFQREVKAAAAIKHPNVIGVHDFVEMSNGMLVMVMDLLAGETLGAVLAREKQLSLAQLATIMLPVVSALEAAHAAGIVHRDLKPDNVFLAKNEDGSIEPRVLDFGIAKLTAAEGLAARTQALTGTGSMVGTPYYMSPEQVVSEKDLDARADVWSLGVVLYECLAGVRPTEAENVGRVLKRIIVADFTPLKAHCPDLPEDVTALVTRMIEGDRDKRARDLGEVREVLTRHAGADEERASAAALVRETPPTSERAPPSFSRADTQRADTHRAVSVAPAKSEIQPEKPKRSRAIATAGLAVVALVGGALAIARETREPAVTSPAAVSASPPSTSPPSASVVVSAVPSSAVVASAPPSPPSASQTAPARPTVATTRATVATAVRPSAPTPPAVSAGTVSAPVAPVASAPPAPTKPPTNIATNPKD